MNNLLLWCPAEPPDTKILYFTLDTFEPGYMLGAPNQSVAGLIREYCLRNDLGCDLTVTPETMRDLKVDMVVSFEKNNNELLAFARNLSIPLVEVFKEGDFYITSVR